MFEFESRLVFITLNTPFQRIIKQSDLTKTKMNEIFVIAFFFNYNYHKRGAKRRIILPFLTTFFSFFHLIFISVLNFPFLVIAERMEICILDHILVATS